MYDFEPVYMSDDSKVLSRPNAIKFMTKTLDIFEEQCKQAYSKVRMTSAGMYDVPEFLLHNAMITMELLLRF